MARLDGKVALVTGAARGQGEAIARRFVAECATVVLVDVLDDQGQAVADSLGPAARYVHLDVAEEADWRRVVDDTVQRFGRLDILVNTAAVHTKTPMLQMALADYQRIVAVNQVGCWLGMRTVAPSMAAGGGGAIVNTASTAGLKGMAGLSAYGSSKFAVRGLTRVAAIELAPENIRVNAVLPGPIVTEMATTKPEQLVGRQPITRLGRQDEVASLMVFLCSDESSYCTGTEVLIDGGSLA